MTGNAATPGEKARSLIRNADRATLATALADGRATALADGRATALADGGATALADGGATALADGGATVLADGGATALADGGATALADGGATALTDGGWPYASLVMVACGQDAAPLLLISDLAEHTRNLATLDRASLLFDGTGGLENPLTGARVTVLGRLSQCDDPLLLSRYVARHPDAAIYAGFDDFHLFRMEIERAHIVAGFGEISWIDAAEVRLDNSAASALIEAEAEIVAHMNDDHAEAIELYATALLGRAGGGWTMTGVDPEGLDLRRGGEIGRVPFARSVDGPEPARAELVKLAKKARSAAG